MSEMEMTNDVETEDFTDELSDEALDREGCSCSRADPGIPRYSRVGS